MSFFYDNTLSLFSPYTGSNDVNHYSVDGDQNYNIGVIRSSVEPNGTGPTFNYFTCMSRNTTSSSTYDYSTIFKIDQNGDVGARGSITPNAYPDYAEYFESFDQSSLEIGSSVVIVPPESYELTLIELNTGSETNNSLTGSNISFIKNKGYIRAATQEDNPEDIIGVVRPKIGKGKPMIIGNSASLEWSSKYLTDDFGNVLLEPYLHIVWTEDNRQKWYPYDKIPEYEKVPENAERVYEDKNGNPLVRPILNPYYEYDVKYVPREERQEWNLVGLLGQIPMLKTSVKNPRWRVLSSISDKVDLVLIR